MKASLICAALMAAAALIPGSPLSPTQAAAQVYGTVDAGNVYRPGVYQGLGRSAYGLFEAPHFSRYHYRYNYGLGQGTYLPSYRRYAISPGSEETKYRLPGTPR